jgi:hypothetical protein
MIQKLFRTSSNYDSYKFNSPLDFSLLDIQQVVAENLSGKNSSSKQFNLIFLSSLFSVDATLITVWDQLLLTDASRIIASITVQNSSTSTHSFFELLVAMIVLVTFH